MAGPRLRRGLPGQGRVTEQDNLVYHRRDEEGERSERLPAPRKEQEHRHEEARGDKHANRVAAEGGVDERAIRRPAGKRSEDELARGPLPMTRATRPDSSASVGTPISVATKYRVTPSTPSHEAITIDEKT